MVKKIKEGRINGREGFFFFVSDFYDFSKSLKSDDNDIKFFIIKGEKIVFISQKKLLKLIYKD